MKLHGAVFLRVSYFSMHRKYTFPPRISGNHILLRFGVACLGDEQISDFGRRRTRVCFFKVFQIFSKNVLPDSGKIGIGGISGF